jgi:hypothetical protein
VSEQEQGPEPTMEQLKAHIDAKHGGPFEEVEWIVQNERADSLETWHWEEHEAEAQLAANDLSTETPDPFGSTQAMLAHVLAQHSGTGTGTWLEQLDEVHEEEHRDPVTKDESGHTHPELERN